jgi:hypothetical protein
MYLKFIVEIIKKNEESCIVIHRNTTMSMRIVLIYQYHTNLHTIYTHALLTKTRSIKYIMSISYTVHTHFN